MDNNNKRNDNVSFADARHFPAPILSNRVKNDSHFFREWGRVRVD